MFKIAQAQTFEERVEVLIPTGNGQYAKGSFMATFELISDDELKELPTDQATARRIVRSVREVGDANGEELPPDQALEAVLSNTCAVTAMVSTYVNATRVKNLRRGN